MSFDGRNHQELLQGDSLRVTTSIYPVPSICAQDQISDWFASLAECLHWNVRKKQKHFDELSDLTRSSSNETIDSFAADKSSSAGVDAPESTWTRVRRRRRLYWTIQCDIRTHSIKTQFSEYAMKPQILWCQIRSHGQSNYVAIILNSQKLHFFPENTGWMILKIMSPVIFHKRW